LKNKKINIYYLTEDINNIKQFNELEYLQQIGRVILITHKKEKNNGLNLKVINLSPQKSYTQNILIIWSKICFLLSRTANSKTDRGFSKRNVYLGSTLLILIINILWKIKTNKYIEKILPIYDQLYFFPFKIINKLIGKKINNEKRIIIHDALILRLIPFSFIISCARISNCKIFGNVKSWDNTFYTQLSIELDGYLVWSESMWKDLCNVHGIKFTKTHLVWGARPFYNFIGQKNKLTKKINGGKFIIGYAGAFYDRYMVDSEIKLIEIISKLLIEKSPDTLIYFRPYPTRPASFYVGLNKLPNVKLFKIPEIVETVSFSFGDDGKELIRYGSDAERLEYLNSCNCFLSLCTSFTIESVISSTPVIQLFISEKDRLNNAEREIFKRFDISDHLIKYYQNILPVATGYEMLINKINKLAENSDVYHSKQEEFKISLGLLEEQYMFHDINMRKAKKILN
jgi:hypothetical protein